GHRGVIMLRRGRGAFALLLVRPPMPLVDRRRRLIWSVPPAVAAPRPTPSPEERPGDQDPEEDREKRKEREEPEAEGAGGAGVRVTDVTAVADRGCDLRAIREALREAVVISAVPNPKREKEREDEYSPSIVAEHGCPHWITAGLRRGVPYW